MPFIIYGTKGVTSTMDAGSFHCPACGPSQYTEKLVKRYFTLYWIPLFPVSTVGSFVECDMCASTWDPEVLSFDPAASQAAFISKVAQAARRLMAMMVLADGEVDDEEIQTMVQVSETLPGDAMTEAEARAEVEAARTDSRDLVGMVLDVRDELNDAGKTMLLRCALAIAAADGDFADEEKLLLLQIGEALGMEGEAVLDAIRQE